MRDRYQRELDEVQAALQDEKYDNSLTLEILKTNTQAIQHGITVPQHVIRLLEKEADLIVTVKRVSSMIAASRRLVSESQSEGTVTGEIKEHENLSDIVGDDVDLHDAGSSIVPEVGQSHLLSIDDFFARPISLGKFPIPISTDINIRLKVWDLYTLAPSVRAKLRNYTYLKADLMVRVAISGTPFHFGKMILSYQPYASLNENITANLANIAISGLHRPQFLNYLSQAPGACTIDYRGNQPVDIKCPFISPKPMHRLFANSTAVLSAATSYPDLAVAGDLFLYSLNQAKAVSPTPSEIYVHLYAWLENVQLGPPTATQIEITTEGYDERKKGPVEKVASFMAMVMNALSTVPSIGVLAKASSYVFQGAAGIASWFGWSRPQIKDHPTFIKNRPFSTTAQTIGVDTVERICFDPMQEITIDPRVCGTDEDELSIAFLSGVQSYLTSFTWAHNSTVMAGPIWMSAVTPQLNNYVYNAALARMFMQPTAMAFVTAPFKYWRGKIKFRLEIVCSNFHRGKLAVTFEPNIMQGALITSGISLNKNYIKIIDIQETQDIEFCINYAQPSVWLETAPMDVQPKFHGSEFVFGNPQYVNGFIAVTPFTALQSPDNGDIAVNVYVSAEDLQLNVLQSANLPISRRLVSESYDEKGNQPQTDYTCIELNSSSDSGVGAAEYCFGEQPVSLRTAMKRYVTTFTQAFSVNATAHSTLSTLRNILQPASPFYSLVTDHTGDPTLIRYLPLAYLGMRGGIRKRFRFSNFGTKDFTAQNAMVASLVSTGGSLAENLLVYAAGTTVCRSVGSAAFLPQTNGGIEIEIPYYSPNLFNFSFSQDFGISELVNNEMFTDWITQYTVTFDHNEVSVPIGFAIETATAEDFTFMRFMGAPYYTVPYLF